MEVFLSTLLVTTEGRSSQRRLYYATDELIGRTIRREFEESTILTIAHRLRTVIDYDKVLLLDQCRIVRRPCWVIRVPGFMGFAELLGSTSFKGWLVTWIPGVSTPGVDRVVAAWFRGGVNTVLFSAQT
ncbi:hypothetical protein FB45DRAFT_862288 [Roridomyces roridus]|uniref:Uncharacterized protein n=1 Tax=Roridomyces roridus TaxID=1738132 RepID=A0AAD7C724_9AGAR|nr:hypothetical protein FB45DRAFT_862288 [Roridomyces roridus]